MPGTTALGIIISSHGIMVFEVGEYRNRLGREVPAPTPAGGVDVVLTVVDTLKLCGGCTGGTYEDG